MPRKKKDPVPPTCQGCKERLLGLVDGTTGVHYHQQWVLVRCTATPDAGKGLSMDRTERDKHWDRVRETAGQILAAMVTGRIDLPLTSAPEMAKQAVLYAHALEIELAFSRQEAEAGAQTPGR